MRDKSLIQRKALKNAKDFDVLTDSSFKRPYSLVAIPGFDLVSFRRTGKSRTQKTNMTTKNSTHKLALSITASILAACGAQAYEVPLTSLNTNLPPIDFHGFLSQGFLDSSKYNYLGDSSRGSFDFTEMGVNASMNPFPRTRITAQGFDFDTGNVGEYHPFLDYALAEYTINDEIGIRAGRIRRPQGIYNAIQDIDLARTYVLLPQGMYDARWRDWSAGLDGGELFGSFSLGKDSKAGSLSYEAYGGVVNMTDDGGVARYIENRPGGDMLYDGIDATPMMGIQVWYNTPIDGLRFGASFAYMDGFGFTLHNLPTALEYYYPGYGEKARNVGNVNFEQYSAEYLWKNWTFQAEFYTYNFSGHSYVSIPGMPNIDADPVLGSAGDNNQTWYGAASYRFNKYFELGGYYTEWRDHDSSPTAYQNDLALSLRVDPKDWWTFKVEGHYIRGTGLLRDNAANAGFTMNGDGWFMLAVKSTFSF